MVGFRGKDRLKVLEKTLLGQEGCQPGDRLTFESMSHHGDRDLTQSQPVFSLN